MYKIYICESEKDKFLGVIENLETKEIVKETFKDLIASYIDEKKGVYCQVFNGKDYRFYVHEYIPKGLDRLVTYERVTR